MFTIVSMTMLALLIVSESDLRHLDTEKVIIAAVIVW